MMHRKKRKDTALAHSCITAANKHLKIGDMLKVRVTQCKNDGATVRAGKRYVAVKVVGIYEHHTNVTSGKYSFSINNFDMLTNGTISI